MYRTVPPILKIISVLSIRSLIRSQAFGIFVLDGLMTRRRRRRRRRIALLTHAFFLAAKAVLNALVATAQEGGFPGVTGAGAGPGVTGTGAGPGPSFSSIGSNGRSLGLHAVAIINFLGGLIGVCM